MVCPTRVKQRAFTPGDDLVIRVLTPEDMTLLGTLLYESFKDSIHRDRWNSQYDAVVEARKVFARKNIIFDTSFVALDGVTPVSMSIVESLSTGPYLTYIGTVAHYRRCGIAGELVNRSLQAMHSRGFVELYLMVAMENKDALSRYRSLGFEVFTERKLT